MTALEAERLLLRTSQLGSILHGWARDMLGILRLISVIAPGNTRSAHTGPADAWEHP